MQLCLSTTDLFKILGALFNQVDLRKKVLNHVKKHWKYYKKNLTVLLKSQKAKPSTMAKKYADE